MHLILDIYKCGHLRSTNIHENTNIWMIRWTGSAHHLPLLPLQKHFTHKHPSKSLRIQPFGNLWQYTYKQEKFLIRVWGVDKNVIYRPFDFFQSVQKETKQALFLPDIYTKAIPPVRLSYLNLPFAFVSLQEVHIFL